MKNYIEEFKKAITNKREIIRAIEDHKRHGTILTNNYHKAIKREMEAYQHLTSEERLEVLSKLDGFIGTTL